ncbi:MAG: hypothetical protein RLY97_1110 [Pseudomonadota bacterium]|jgi:hypothetical protein
MQISPNCRAFAPFIAVTLAFGLGGCTAHGDYPSLARRPIERISGTAQVAPATPPTIIAETPAASADLASKLSALEVKAHISDSQFRSKIALTETTIAAGHGTEIASKAWSNAMTALSDLETTRTDTAKVLIALDVLEIANRNARLTADQAGSADPRILAVRDEIGGIIADEDKKLKALRITLGL